MDILRSKKKKRSLSSLEKSEEVCEKLNDLVCGDILDTVICKSNEIYSHLGSGHTETVYHRAMEAELRELGIKYESEVITPIMYKNYYVGYGRADIVINRLCTKDTIVLELKALSANTFKSNEIARLKTYMKSLGIKKGIMINFPQTPSSGKCIFHYVCDE